MHLIGLIDRIGYFKSILYKPVLLICLIDRTGYLEAVAHFTSTGLQEINSYGSIDWPGGYRCSLLLEILPCCSARVNYLKREF